MCIIIDPPVFIPMFKSTDPEHEKFLPVKNWVEKGIGKFVIGGSQYREELSRVKSILSLLAEFEKGGKVRRSNDAIVDKEILFIRKIEPSLDFDDPHLVALVRASGCKLICIRDPRSHRFLRATKFYNALHCRPKLYTREKNANLLCPNNIANCCK